MSKVVQQRPRRHIAAAGTVQKAVAPTNAFGEAPPSRSGVVIPGTEHLLPPSASADAAAAGPTGSKVAGTWGLQQISKKEKRKLKHDKFRSTFLLPGETPRAVNGVHVPRPAPAGAAKTNALSFSDAFQAALPSKRELKAAAADAAAASAGAASARARASGQVTELTNATRAKAAQDRERFGLVLAHPVFRANPLATIKEHLQNEMALAAAGEQSMRALAKTSKAKKAAGAGKSKGGNKGKVAMGE